MNIGLQLNVQAPPGTNQSEIANNVIEQTQIARDAGFDLIVRGQHYLSDYTSLQAIPLLSRLAADAGDMTLATGVLLLPLGHPVDIAEQIATIDSFATNVICGVGAGYRDVEFESFGIPKRERGQRLTEGIELLNALWTSNTVTYTGNFYSVEDVSLSVRPTEKPRVWVAANTRPAIERAARLGDAWYVNPHATISEIAQQKQTYDEIRKEHGKETTVPIFREAFVAPTRAEAVETVRDSLTEKYQQYISWGQDDAMEDSTDLHRPFDELADDRFILGTPTDVCAEIERYQEELDASHVVFRIQWGGPPLIEQAKVLDCLELIGDEIIPNV